MDDNKKFWERCAWIYEKFIRGSKAADKAYSEMESQTCSQLNKNMKVLELAAGPGIMSAKIASACGTLEVTDFSAEMLNKAKKRKNQDNVSFAVADATNLVYDNLTFDAVIIANALHIMPEPQKAMHEIKRVLKKDGILIAPTFTRVNVKSKLMERLIEFYGFKTYSKWTHESYQKFMEHEGLEICYKSIILGQIFPISFLVCKKK